MKGKNHDRVCGEGGVVGLGVQVKKTADERVLAAIKRRYKETYECQHLGGMETVHEHMPLEDLYLLKDLGAGEIWAALSRLVLAGKIKATGSNRYKSYAPTDHNQNRDEDEPEARNS